MFHRWFYVVICINTGTSLGIGSIDFILTKISLPRNFELTIFCDKYASTGIGSGNTDLAQFFMEKLNPAIGTSVQNISNLFGPTSTSERIVQRLYIFAHQNSTSLLNHFKQLRTHNKLETNYEISVWKPIYVFVWPTNCTMKDDKPDEKLLFKMAEGFSLKDDVYLIHIPCGNKTEASNISIYEFYSIGNKSFVHKFGFKILKSDHPWHILGNKISRRKDFGGIQISATAPNDLDYAQESEYVENSTVKFKGGTSVLRYWFLRDGLNFSELAVPDAWTSEDANGDITGGGRRVMNGSVDISITQSAMTEYKKRSIDFLMPTDESILRAFFIQPPASKYRDIFISPFKADLWIAMFSTWLLITITLRIFAWIQSKSYEVDKDDNEIVTDSWIWAIGTACQQGWYIQPVSLSIRITFALGHLTGLVCFAAYSASIVSFLSLRAVPMKSFTDILENSFRVFANENTTPIAYILPELKQQRNFPQEVLIHEQESIPKIMHSKSAVVAYMDVFSIEAKLLNFTDRTICETIDSVRINWVTLRSGMIVRKGSPFREFFNYQIMLMLEGGLNHRYLSMYNRDTETSCLKFTTGHKQALGILDVLTAGIILFVGYVLSFIIFLLELFIASKNRSLHSVNM